MFASVQTVCNTQESEAGLEHLMSCSVGSTCVVGSRSPQWSSGPQGSSQAPSDPRPCAGQQNPWASQEAQTNITLLPLPFSHCFNTCILILVLGLTFIVCKPVQAALVHW